MKFFLNSLLLLLSFSSIICEAGIEEYTVKQSRYSVGATMDRLENLIRQKGSIIFSRIYHSVGVKKAGIQKRPIQLLIFGKPKAGSPLIIENPLVALDLPLKVLAWQDDNNQTWLAYLNPTVLQKRHNLQNTRAISEMKSTLNSLTNQALGIK